MVDLGKDRVLGVLENWVVLEGCVGHEPGVDPRGVDALAYRVVHVHMVDL